MVLLNLIEKHLWLICGVIIGSLAGWNCSSCWLGPFYGILIIAGTPTLLVLVFPLGPVSRYSLWLGASFTLVSVAQGATWPAPVYGMTFAAATLIICVILNLIDRIMGNPYPVVPSTFSFADPLPEHPLCESRQQKIQTEIKFA